MTKKLKQEYERAERQKRAALTAEKIFDNFVQIVIVIIFFGCILCLTGGGLYLVKIAAEILK